MRRYTIEFTMYCRLDGVAGESEDEARAAAEKITKKIINENQGEVNDHLGEINLKVNSVDITDIEDDYLS